MLVVKCALVVVAGVLVGKAIVGLLRDGFSWADTTDGMVGFILFGLGALI